MAGLVKQKKINIADSNIANLGTEFEKKCRVAAASKEEQWHDAGKAPGLEIWRIENFEVKDWPKEEYGKFYSGDSYIVLHTYKKSPDSDALAFDVHFWIGTYTTQDEYGTAAYKTVELDDMLGGAPVQHREVQGYESKLFLSYFKTFFVMDGGVESGFNHVTPEEYRPRLLKLKGKKPTVVSEVPMERDSLNSGDCFILDLGLELVQWNGKSASGFEKAEAAKVARAIDDERAGKAEVTVLEEGDDRHPAFWEKLGGRGDIKSAEEGGPDSAAATPKRLMHLSDASGSMSFKEVATGTDIKRDLLNSDDVFVFDTGFEVFVWIGQGASAGEKSKGLAYAEQYLKDNGRPVYIPITRILEGGENETFNALFH